MKRLLYISTARADLNPNELETLLAQSRRANAAAGLTGLLIVGGRRFLQVLEGPEAAVTSTYDRIRRDDRHFALVKLHEKNIEARSFASWAMGFERGGSVAPSATLAEQVSSLVAPIADATLRAYFTGFAEVSLSNA